MSSTSTVENIAGHDLALKGELKTSTRRNWCNTCGAKQVYAKFLEAG